METIDLTSDSSADLARLNDPGAWLAAVRKVSNWTEREARTLDGAYVAKFARMLRSNPGPDELAAWSDHLARVTHPARRTALDRVDASFATRWEAFRDLIEARIAMLRAGVPDALLKTGRIEAIVTLVLKRGAVPQQEIVELLGTGKSNASQLLDRLETHELIERRREGRRNDIVPGAKALQWDLERSPVKPQVLRGVFSNPRTSDVRMAA